MDDEQLKQFTTTAPDSAWKEVQNRWINLRHQQYAMNLRTLELLISMTPTGEERNWLTDANLMLMQAKDLFNKEHGL